MKRWKWKIVAAVGAAVVLFATTAWALTCIAAVQEATLEVESVTIDGVEQTDLSAWQAFDVRVRAHANDPSRLTFVLTEPDAAVEKVYLWEQYDAK